MTIVQEMIEAFRTTPLNTQFTRGGIIEKVHLKFGRTKESIIPSDYCYNRLNNGISYEKQPHLFEYTYDKKYVYLGLDFPYTGKIFHKPKGCSEICVGELINGTLMSDISGVIVYKEKRETLVDDLFHKTKREIGLQLRFKVLKRDNFKCCACGASPAKDPSIELHLDHIIPWAKGGETVMDNLQTLCSKCNLGKSDLL